MECTQITTADQIIDVRHKLTINTDALIQETCSITLSFIRDNEDRKSQRAHH